VVIKGQLARRNQHDELILETSTARPGAPWRNGEGLANQNGEQLERGEEKGSEFPDY